jgi:hypothetical protein
MAWILSMDRRNFLKRLFAASIIGAVALRIEVCKGLAADGKENGPSRIVKTGDLAADRMVYGGGLFNGYARSRDSVDGAGLKIFGRRLSRTGFFAGRQTGNSPGTQYFC